MDPVMTPEGYEYRLLHSPTFTALVVHLYEGQKVVAERGALMYMHRTIEIETKRRSGGLLKGLMISAFGGESFLVNTFHAKGEGDVGLVGPNVGDIRAVNVAEQGMILQSGSFLASNPAVELDTKYQGLKGFVSEKDVVMLRASGGGTVWLTSFGGLVEMDLEEGEHITVDTGHLVAFSDNMTYHVRRIGGMKATLLSGEGLVSDFTGPGKLFLQTRHLPDFARQLIPYLPQAQQR